MDREKDDVPPGALALAKDQGSTGSDRAAAQSGVKDASIETLRGLAILLVVAVHAHEPPVPFVDGPGLSVVYGKLISALELIRMPLFTVVSGYVYALRPVRSGDGRTFLKGKLRRLGLPFLSGVTIALLASAVLGTHQQLPLRESWRAYVYVFQHYWYLQSLLEIFLVVVVLERFGALSTFQGWVACLTVTSVALLLVPRSYFLALYGFKYLLPFFLWGVGLRRFGSALDRGDLRAAALLTGGVALVLQQLATQGAVQVSIEKDAPLALVGGLALTYAAFAYRRPLSWLVPVGVLSYSIFLFHMIGISVGKRVALLASVHSNDLYFVLKCAGGVAVPVIVDTVARRVTVLRRLLLGLN